jgi:hypothetical protein
MVIRKGAMPLERNGCMLDEPRPNIGHRTSPESLPSRSEAKADIGFRASFPNDSDA